MELEAKLKQIDEEMWLYWKHYYKELLGLNDWEERCYKRLEEENVIMNEIMLWTEIKQHLKGVKVLDVGCGTGGFCIAALKESADVFGIDKDSKAIEICRLKASIHSIPLEHFQVSTAENLPFKENTFDFIFCNSVLEHVNDVAKTISEMLRVTKQHGILFIKFPDYRSIYEAHYKISWIPKMPKNIARIYLEMLGRNPIFIDSINYITFPNIKRKIEDKVEINNKKIIYCKNILERLLYKVLNIGRYVELIVTKK